MALTVKTYMVGALGTNCYLVSCDRTGESAVIDPGGTSNELMDDIHATILTSVLLTHGHFDHIAGVDDIAAATGANVLIHETDMPLLGDATANGSFMIGGDITVTSPAETVSEGDIITVGVSSLEVLHTPGHTPGCITFFTDGMAFGGDLLFRMSVGRWDLPGGDFHTLLRSLKTMTGMLEPDTVVYPGHGGETTIGFELSNNPFLNE